MEGQNMSVKGNAEFNLKAPSAVSGGWVLLPGGLCAHQPLLLLSEVVWGSALINADTGVTVLKYLQILLWI